MMIFSLFTGAALSLTVVSASTTADHTRQQFEQAVVQQPRHLQSLDLFCGDPVGFCTVCEAVGCDYSAILDELCDACSNSALGIPDQVCTECSNCGTNPDCDPEALVTLGCDICDVLSDGGGDDGDSDLGGDDACFSEISTVQVRATGSVAMKDLRVGDYVLTNSNKYEEVYAFAHFHPSKPTSFLQIHSENTDRPLEVTGDHLVFLQGKNEPIPSQAIKVGDVLQVQRGTSHVGSTVTKITSVERKGIYAPLTSGGTLLVDGVVVSSYIYLKENKSYISHQQLAQLAFSPYRMLCKGISSKFCETSSYNEDGMPYYVQYGLEILRWVLHGNFVKRMVGITVVVLFLGCCQLAEGIFGAYAPLVAFLFATFGASKLKTKKAKTL